MGGGVNMNIFFNSVIFIFLWDLVDHRFRDMTKSRLSKHFKFIYSQILGDIVRRGVGRKHDRVQTRRDEVPQSMSSGLSSLILTKKNIKRRLHYERYKFIETTALYYPYLSCINGYLIKLKSN